jgi:glycosyltransferase involved in cell wall biosynthesis
MIENVFISVIIPTRNRSLLLEKLLNSLRSQTLDTADFEIIIVDNGSTDNTKNVVETAIPSLLNLRYVYEPNPGLHAGRHRGFQEAQGGLLVYADDDIEAFPTWLETIKACFLQENVAMVGGKNLPNFEMPPPEWLVSMWQPNAKGEKVLGYLSILDLGNEPKPISPYFIFGCNFAIHRSVLQAAAGFHPDGMPQKLIRYRGDGETYVAEYVASEGYTAFYHPEASVYHWVPAKRMTIEYFCHRAYSQGISDSYTQVRKSHELSSQGNSNEPDHLSGYISTLIAKIQAIFLRDCDEFLRKRTEFLFKIFSYSRCNVSAPLLKIELEKIQSQIQAAYQEGYNFHQMEIFDDPTLLEWVLRSDYWDYRLPSDYER